MTPRRSVRAEARRLYREMVGEGGGASANTAPPTPDPSPPLAEPVIGPAQEGRTRWLAGGGEKPDLMAHVRRMYEDSIIPVRDIAQRAGVTERTLYKYARKRNWKPRYAWMPDGSRPPARPGRRRWTPAQEKQQARAEQFAPGQGAGGRFIRREEIGTPFAHGIKAVDAAGRAAAAEASAEADRIAERARLEAECRSAWQAKSEALAWVVQGLRQLNRLTDAARKAGREIDPIDERCVWRQIDVAKDSWTFAIRDEQAAQAALAQFDRDNAAAPVTSACSMPS